jgi:hypothetical protein
MRDRFFVRLLRGSLPLIIWAAHWFGMYLSVAAQCSAALITPQAPRGWMLGVLSVLAVGACAALLWRASSTLRRAGDDAGLLAWAAAGSALLATVGIVWTSVPIMMIAGCG